MTQEYLLATPVKNEEDNLPDLISSVLSQIKRPLLWVMVDDGSTDKSSELIKQACDKYPWIRTIRLQESPRDIGFHISQVYRSGFSKALEISSKEGIDYDYIGVLDADMKLENDYYSKLIEFMEKDKKIGIASGEIWSYIDGKYVREIRHKNYPSGGARFIRKKCYLDIGGYEYARGADSISIARANLRGWKTDTCTELKVYQSRPVSSADGVWIGSIKNGESHYFRHIHPIVVFSRAGLMGIKLMPKSALAYLYGYIRAYYRKEPRLMDPELIRHFRTKSIKTLLGDER